MHPVHGKCRAASQGKQDPCEHAKDTHNHHLL